MSYVPGSGGNTPSARPHLPATAGQDGLDDRTAAEAGLERESAVADRVGWTFISLYAVYVGVHQHQPAVPCAPAGHPGVEGQLAGGDRTGTQQPGVGHRDRRPVGNGGEPVLRQAERPHRLAAGYAAALDADRPGGRFPRHPPSGAGPQHCGGPGRLGIAQLLFNALLAALAAVLPDQVPVGQRGLVAGFLGVCVPIASVSGTFLVQLFTGNRLAMFLAPCAIGGCFILLFAAVLNDRRLGKADKPTWSPREFASTFYFNPGGARTSPGRSPAASCSCWPTPS